MTTIRRYADVGASIAGACCLLAAVAIIAGWPWSLALAGIGLLGLGIVMPTWD